MDKLQNAKFFTKLDVRLSYNNVRIREGDEWKAAFKTPFGLFEPTVMFFGMTNSPATFQHMMDTIFRPMLDKDEIIVYMDDILIFAEDQPKLVRRTHQVLQTLLDNDLYLKLEKCEFNKQKLEYLGHIITPGRVEMDPTKLDGIRDWPLPRTTRDVRKFIGFTNYYRRFIHHYSDITKPLNSLLSKKTHFSWNDEANQAFERLKAEFLKQPVLITPDQSKPFEIECDASKYASGAVLSQKDNNGSKHPICFLSKSFSPTERRYDIHDRELLAIHRALEEWRHYLEGSPHMVLIKSDHQNLTYWNKPQKVNHQQARWFGFLSRFNFKIEHTPGAKIPIADALSRRPDHVPENDENDEEITILPNDRWLQPIDLDIQKSITSSSKYNPHTLSTLQNLLDSKFDMVDKKYLLYTTPNSPLLLFENRVVIPDDLHLKRSILHRYHDHITAGHPGEQETLRKARQEVYWPGLTTFVRNYIQGCTTCQQNKINRHPSTPALNPIDPPKSTQPFAQISMDLLTDLGNSIGNNGNTYDTILSIVDHGLSNGAIFVPTTKTSTATDIASLIMANIYPRYGLPDKMITDRDPRFNAKTIKAFLGKLGINQAFSTAFHPQTDGKTERYNQEIAAYLSIYCSQNPSTWAQHLPILEYVHNSRPHTDRQQSPFEIIMGITPPGIPSIIETPSIKTAEDRLWNIDKIQDEAITPQKLAADRMRARIRSTFKPFSTGQKVWLEAKNLRLSLPSKIRPRRLGPYKIKRVLSHWTYELKLPSRWKIHPIFHASLLTPYHENDVYGPPDIPPSPEIIEGEEEYEIEGIVSHRQRDNQIEYLVKWKGYSHDENEWMPESTLLPHSSELLMEYQAAKNIPTFLPSQRPIKRRKKRKERPRTIPTTT